MEKLKAHLGPVVRDLVLGFIAAPIWPARFRPRLLRMVGHDIHPSAFIGPGTFLGARRGLTMAERTFINNGCFLDLHGPVTIGRDTGLSYGVMIITAHHVTPKPGDGRILGPAVPRAVTIGKSCVIGARATILPGVTIGDYVIVGAGAVVARNLESGGVYAGSPAVRTGNVSARRIAVAKEDYLDDPA